MSGSGKVFFEAVRPMFSGGTLRQDQVDSVESLLAESANLPRHQRAYILATVFHETGQNMGPRTENLNYTSASRIRAVWQSRFPTDASALYFVRNPQALANKVYNGRMGNRPNSNDGWDYRGRGPVQLTGADNYERAGKALGVDLLKYPDLANGPANCFKICVLGMSQGWFTGRKLGDYAAGDYVPMRGIVNPDKEGALVAGYAKIFEAAFIASDDYSPAASVASQSSGLIGLILALLRGFKK